MKSAPTVKTDPVLEAIAKALFGIDTVPAEYRPRMIKNAARAAKKAAQKASGCLNCKAKDTDLCAPDKCSNCPPWPDCSEPDDRWPNYINACLRDIKRFRKQMIDPAG